MGKAGERFLQHLANANNEAKPELMHLALKLATGAGKTTVMAMTIAWQTLNAVRRPNSKAGGIYAVVDSIIAVYSFKDPLSAGVH